MEIMGEHSRQREGQVHRTGGWSVPGVCTEQQEAGAAGVRQLRGLGRGRGRSRRKELEALRGVTKGFVVIVITSTSAPVEWELWKGTHTWGPASLTKAGLSPSLLVFCSSSNHRKQPRALAEYLAAGAKQGQQPWCVCLSLGGLCRLHGVTHTRAHTHTHARTLVQAGVSLGKCCACWSCSPIKNLSARREEVFSSGSPVVGSSAKAKLCFWE